MKWRGTKGKFPETDPELAAERDLRGNGHATRPQYRPIGRHTQAIRSEPGDADRLRQRSWARHLKAATSGRVQRSTAIVHSEARSGRSGKAASAYRPSCAGRARSPRGWSRRRSCNSPTCYQPSWRLAADSVDPAWHVDGINQLAVWTGNAVATERTLFWEWQSEGSNQLAALRGPLQDRRHARGKARALRRRGRPRRAPRYFRPTSRVDQAVAHELDAWLKTATRQ